MLVGRHAWQRFSFARRTDPKIIFEKSVEQLHADHLRDHWDSNSEHIEQRHFTDFAEIPANSFKVDVDVMERAK